MLVQNWVDVVVVSLQNLWVLFVGFLPSLIGALVILVAGVIVGAILHRVVERVIFYLRLDDLLRRFGLESYLQRAHLSLNSGHFMGRVTYWFIFLAFLLAASDVLAFTALSGFVRDILNYIPDVLVAVLIVLASLITANFLRGLVRASVLGAQLHAAKALGTLTWWVVIVFGFLTALLQLGIAVSVINTVITGLIAMFAIAGGLAFGLGGKDYANYLVSRFREETERK